MGLLDKIRGKSGSTEPDDNYECRSCKTTYETNRVACDSCGGEITTL